MKTLQRNDLLYPELSYQIIGCAFEVYNSLGGGHDEKYYQRALSESFCQKKIKIKEQVYYPVYYQGKIIGRNFLDFLVEDKIIVEIKKGDHYAKKHIDQVLRYLQESRLKLAILINFGAKEVLHRRVINFESATETVGET